MTKKPETAWKWAYCVHCARRCTCLLAGCVWALLEASSFSPFPASISFSNVCRELSVTRLAILVAAGLASTPEIIPDSVQFSLTGCSAGPLQSVMLFTDWSLNVFHRLHVGKINISSRASMYGTGDRTHRSTSELHLQPFVISSFVICSGFVYILVRVGICTSLLFYK